VLTVTGVVNSRDINFSRKREPTSPLPPKEDNTPYGSKRQRHNESNYESENNVPRPSTAVANNAPSNGRISSLSNRLSRFKEDSMHDKPSEKPPSVFLRVLQRSSNPAPAFDDLMEEYHETNEKPRPISTARSSKHATQLSGLTHHPNTSITSSATFANSTQSRESGIFRFGRSVASSFNPVNLWKKVTNSRENKEEDRDNDGDSDLIERQIRAEQAYSKLKLSGQLGKLGTHIPSPEKRVYTPGYTAPASAMTDEIDNNETADAGRKRFSDTAGDTSRPQRISATPGKGSASKRFHIRTPSLNDLKRIASDATLNRRTSLAALNTEKTNTADVVDLPEKSLRTSRSKKDLAKAAKLSRRVSDLEAKLEAARRDLNDTVSNAPPVPPLPNSRPGSRSTVFRRFQPMPSLPSESLLVKPDEKQTEETLVAFSKTNIENAVERFSQQRDNNRQRSVSVQDIAPTHESALFGDRSEDAMHWAIKKSAGKASRSRIADEELVTHLMLQSPSRRSKKQYQTKSNGPRQTTTPSSTLTAAVPEPLTNFSLPTAITVPVGVATHLVGPPTEPRSSLETVQEEMCSIISSATTRVPLQSPLHKATAISTPAALPRRSQHQHMRSMSPIKSPERGSNAAIDTQRYRDREASPRGVLKKKRSGTSSSGPRTPPRRVGVQTVWLQPNGLDVPPLPCQTSPLAGGSAVNKSRNSREMRRGDRFDWPDDCF
jgi:hypothetical protein